MVTKTIKLNRKRYFELLEEDMKFCSLSESTMSQYRFIVSRYLDFTNNNPTFTRREIMSFSDSLGQVTSTYASWCLAIVKRFHKTIQDILPDGNKKWPLGPREGPKIVVRQQPSFSMKDVNRLFDIISDTRDYAIARLLFATGMRRDEICRLKKNDYNNSTLTFLMAKGEETRTVKLDRETCVVLDQYLKTRSDEYSTLFVNDHSRPFTPDALSQAFRKYFRAMGLGGRVGLHSFRRGLVRVLHDRGLPREEIQKFYGWKTATMVDRYLQISESEIGKMVSEIHPFYEKK